MSLSQIGINVSRGVGEATEYQFLRQGNYDANLGMNHILSTITSFQLIGITLRKINTVIKNIEFDEISPIPTYITFSASVFIPFLLTYTKKSINFTSHPNIHTIIKTLDYQILPNVLLVANLVSAIGLIALGNPLYGGCNLTFLLLNFLDEQGWINTDCVKKNLFFTNVLLACETSYLLTSLNLYNAFSLLNILADTIHKIVCARNNVANAIHPITLQEFESKCSVPFLHYRLSNYHLLKKPISDKPIPDLENQFDQYAPLLKSYLEQDLSMHTRRLLDIFRSDEKWQTDYNNNPIDYLKDGINSLVSYIGRLNRTKKLKNEFLSLVKYMSNLPEEERISLLAQLAQIGHYCPERKYIDINRLYDTYIDTIEKRSLSNKILSILHQDRIQILDQFLTLPNGIKSLLTAETNRQGGAQKGLFNITARLVASFIPSFEDVHFANFIKEVLSSYLYVHYTSIDVFTENRSILEKWFLDILYKGPIRLAKQMFFDQYNSYTVLKRIMNSINNEPIIAFNEMQEWFIKEYRDSFPKATLDEAITWVHRHVYNIDSGLIEPRYLLFFLINQGVLELIEDGQDTRDVAILRLPLHRRQAV